MAQGIDQKVCLITEATLQQVSNGLYDSIEAGRSTYGVAAAIEDNSNGVINDIINVSKTQPGDLTCTDVHAQVKFLTPDCADGGTTNVSFDCTTVTPSRRSFDYEDVEISDFVGEELALDFSLFQCDCDDPLFDQAVQLASVARKMYKAYNEKLATKIIAGVGTDFAGTSTATTPLPLKMFSLDALGRLQPQPMGLFAVENQYDNMLPQRTVDPVIITGSSKVKAYAKAQSIWAGNEDGFDAGRGMLENVYYDPALLALTTGVADDPAFSFLPGTLQIMDYYDFATEGKAMNGPSYFQPMMGSGVLRDDNMIRGVMNFRPFIGRDFFVDVQIRYDNCQGKYGTVEYKFRKIFDLFKTPQRALCTGTTWNLCMLWDIECSPYGCTDIEN